MAQELSVSFGQSMDMTVSPLPSLRLILITSAASVFLVPVLHPNHLSSSAETRAGTLSSGYLQRSSLIPLAWKIR